MKTLKYTQMSLAVVTIFMISGCIATQQPAPVFSGSDNNYSVTEPQSSAEPYKPREGYDVPPPVSSYPSSGSYVPSYAPVDVNAKKHTVVRGDTVFNISKRYNISQDNLRQWNNIVDNNISVGQVLWVKNPNGSYPSPRPQASSPVVNNSSPSVIATSGGNSGLIRTVDGVTWMKPAQGQIVTKFSSATKGIEIIGEVGSPIVAVADGKVIYSSTLDGYGKLIIVQHNTKYLTAYGNNQANLVKEGDIVKRGQKIATMGKTDAPRVQLHFELRKDGQAIDPLGYIPGY